MEHQDHKVMVSRDKYPRIEIGKPSKGEYIVVLLEKSKKRLHVAGRMRVFKTHLAKVVGKNQSVIQKQVIIQSQESLGFGIILTDSNLSYFNFTDQLSVEK